MKKRFSLLWIILIYILFLICCNMIDKNFLSNNILFVIALGFLVLIYTLLLLIRHLLNKHVNRHKTQIYYISCNIKKEPENKSSNDELMDLISEYEKNNKSGEQK